MEVLICFKKCSFCKKNVLFWQDYAFFLKNVAMRTNNSMLFCCSMAKLDIVL